MEEHGQEAHEMKRGSLPRDAREWGARLGGDADRCEGPPAVCLRIQSAGVCRESAWLEQMSILIT